MALELFDRPVDADLGMGSVSLRDRVSTINFNNFRRPFRPTKGPNADRPCVLVNLGLTTNEKGEQVPVKRQARVMDLLNDGVNIPTWVLNASPMRPNDWIQLDSAVQQSYRNRLKFWADLMAKVPLGGFNAYGKLTYEYDAMSDAHEAIVDMDGLSAGRGDNPLFLSRSVPLPITHSKFSYSDRTLAVSQNRGPGLSVYSAEQAGRRIAEMVEDTAIGIQTGMTYGTRASYFAHDLASTVFGATNYTNRNTKTNFTVPTTTNGPTSYADFLAAFETLRGDKVYGPYSIYHSTDWSQYMDSPFSTAGGNHPSETLRTMLLKNPDVASVQRLDRLTSTFTVLILSLTSDVVQAINGQDITTIMWEERGGMLKCWMCYVIQAPLWRSDYSGNCGLLHGTTA